MKIPRVSKGIGKKLFHRLLPHHSRRIRKFPKRVPWVSTVNTEEYNSAHNIYHGFLLLLRRARIPWTEVVSIYVLLQDKREHDEVPIPRVLQFLVEGERVRWLAGKRRRTEEQHWWVNTPLFIFFPSGIWYTGRSSRNFSRSLIYKVNRYLDQ